MKAENFNRETTEFIVGIGQRRKWQRESKTEKGKARELVCYARGLEAHTQSTVLAERQQQRGNYREKGLHTL